MAGIKISPELELIHRHPMSLQGKAKHFSRQENIKDIRHRGPSMHYCHEFCADREYPGTKAMKSVLSEDEIKSFIEDGYVYVRRGFSQGVAESCRNILWEHLAQVNIHHDASLSWIPKHSIAKTFHNEDGHPWTQVLTPRVVDYVNDICGRDTLTCDSNIGLGWWMVTFPGFSVPPWDADGKYHVDGHWFQHYSISREIGCVLIVFFSDVLPDGGGTAVAVGSHKCIARALTESASRGLRPCELAHCVDMCLSSAQYPLEELSGQAGDVVIMHPFLIHARSKNLAPVEPSSVRFMCHPHVPLHADLNFSKPMEEMTPLERSIYVSCEGHSTSAQNKCENTSSCFREHDTAQQIPSSTDEALCPCCFHESGENLQLHLRQITPERCAEIAMRAKKRTLEDLSYSTNHSENGAVHFDGDSNAGTAKFPRTVIPEKWLSCMDADAIDNSEENITSSCIHAVMGFSEFSTSRTTTLDDTEQACELNMSEERRNEKVPLSS